MENKINKIITLDDNQQYMVIDQGIYQKRNYFLLSKMIENNPSKELTITEEDQDIIKVVTDENILNVLKNYFNRRINNW